MSSTYTDILQLQRKIKEHTVILEELLKRGPRGQTVVDGENAVIISNEIKIIKKQLMINSENMKMIELKLDTIISIVSDITTKLPSPQYTYPIYPDYTVTTNAKDGTEDGKMSAFEKFSMDNEYIPDVGGNVTADARVADKGVTVEGEDFASILDALDSMNDQECTNG
jgi:hypothetical protein